MGIRSVDFMSEGSEWCVLKVKSYADVVAGEHWLMCGCRYQE